jgi:hypothetical protein
MYAVSSKLSSLIHVLQVHPLAFGINNIVNFHPFEWNWTIFDASLWSTFIIYMNNFTSNHKGSCISHPHN